MDFNKKSNVVYDFWTRSTIPWSLECDNQDGKSRKEIQELVRNTVVYTEDGNNDSLRNFVTLIVVFSCVLCVAASCFGGFIFRSGEAGGIIAAVAVIAVLISAAQVGFTITALVKAGNAVASNALKVEAVESYSILNGCSDEFTQLPEAFMTENVNYAT